MSGWQETAGGDIKEPEGGGVKDLEVTTQCQCILKV